MKFKEIERIVKKDGWVLKNIKGSHHHYTHQIKKGKVTIPSHPGDIPKIIVKSIIKQAKLEEELK